MTDASKEWHSALRTLRRNGRVARADWPTDVFAPEQLGLTIWGAFISMPETVCLYDEAYLDAQLKQVDVPDSSVINLSTSRARPQIAPDQPQKEYGCFDFITFQLNSVRTGPCNLFSNNI